MRKSVSTGKTNHASNEIEEWRDVSWHRVIFQAPLDLMASEAVCGCNKFRLMQKNNNKS